MKFNKKILIPLLVFLFLPSFIFGEGKAKLFLSPSSGTFNVGKTFNVSIKVDSGGGVGINAAETVLKFDPQYLTVSSLSKSGSIFTLWPVEPSFSNAEGQITFGGGSPTAYTANSGTIVTITFLAKKEGKTEVKFASGSVLAADGMGTNVLGQMLSATFELKTSGEVIPPKEEKPKEELPTGKLPLLPEVSSPTHPDPQKWYSNNNPEFTWKLPLDVIGVSLLFNEKSSSNPGTVSDGLIESKKYEKVEDGIWYFHIRFQSKSGWGPTLHRQVLIDTKAPEPFDLTVKREDSFDPKPVLQFFAIDTLSGIEKYQILVDEKEVAIVSPETLEKNPFFELQPLAPGKHLIEVKAIDKAGNNQISSKEIEVESLRPPVFVSLASKLGEFSLQPPQISKIPPKISTEDWLIIKGTSVYSEATVKIFIAKAKGKEEPIIKEVKTDKDGNWFLIFDQKLEKGDYLIWAQLFDKRGAQSPETEKINLKVISFPFFQKYSLLIIIFLILIIILLILYIFYQRKKHKKEIELIKKEYHQLKDKISRMFSALREEVKEQVEVLDKRPGLSRAEKELHDKLKEALEISEAFLGEEMADFEKILQEKEKNEKK